MAYLTAAEKTVAPGHSFNLYSKPIIGKDGTHKPVMMTSYDYRLVVLSILISTLASYAALDLAGRVTAARGRVRLAWLAGGLRDGDGHLVDALHWHARVQPSHHRRLRLADGGSLPPVRYFRVRRGPVRGQPPATVAGAS